MSGAARDPALWPWASLLAASLGLAILLAWQITPQLGRPPVLRPRPVPRQVAPLPMAGGHRGVRLFFPQESSDTFKEQEREIPRRSSPAEEIRAVLRELSRGVSEGLPPLPPGIEARHVFVDSFGIAYLDFPAGIQAVVAVPGPQTERAILAVVTTLTTSFSEIKRVQFLADGQEMTVVTRGLDLRRPIQPRFPGEEAPPVVSLPQE
jgi:hypothetical protein